ncbi:MAG: hypothetical protein KatS3mg131_3279 [Candidatus Tectimicrobiota bacterium]|nr:MAG: hypothetical protein KatS3mg131_3279 [Candidatus Tectomicrobia bacterium]
MRTWEWLLLALLLAGCATVHPRGPAGFGTYSYVTGTLTWTYPVALKAAWEATLQAVQGLDLRIEKQLVDGLGGTLEAKRADGTPVFVWLRPLTERTTEVQVRIGTYGNRDDSERLHTAIRKQLRL